MEDPPKLVHRLDATELEVVSLVAVVDLVVDPVDPQEIGRQGVILLIRHGRHVELHPERLRLAGDVLTGLVEPVVDLGIRPELRIGLVEERPDLRAGGEEADGHSEIVLM